MTGGDGAAAALRRWLARSAPQTADGAYCGWRDAATGASSFAYPEITGYLLTFAAYRGWSAAQAPGVSRAATWLAAACTDGSLRCRPDKPGDTRYLFDLAMIAQGLLRHGTHVADPTLVGVGLDLVREIRTQLPPHVPTLRPLAADRQSEPNGPVPTWSTAGTVHLLKVLQCLLTAGELGDAAADEAADLLVASAGTPFNRGDAPPIVTCPGAEVVSLHAACYAAEGLWVYAMARRRGPSSVSVGSSRQAGEITRWVWAQQRADGGFPGFVTVDGREIAGAGRPVRGAPPAAQSDVLAQAVRLARLTGVDVDGLDAAVSVLAACTIPEGDGAAVVYAPDSGRSHLNTWTTMFAAQALDLQEPRASPFDWRDLV